MNISDYYTFTTIQKERIYRILHKGNTIQRENIEHVSVKMLESTSIPNVLPLIVEQLDTQLCIQYDITGLQTLKEYTSTKGFYMDDLYQLLQSIVSIVEQNGSQLLDLNKFCLYSEDLIYVETHLHKLRLMYIPLKQIEYNQPFQHDILALISNLSEKIVDFNPPQYKRLFEVLQNPNFQLDHLKQIIASLPDQLQNESEIEQSVETPAHPKESKNPILSIKQGVGVILLAGAWGYYYASPSEIAMYVASVLTGVSLYLLAGRYFKKKKIEEVREQPVVETEIFRVPVNPISSPSVEQPRFVNADPTVLLHSETQRTNPVPQRAMKQVAQLALRMQSGQKIIVSHTPYTIGRNEDVVDYVFATVGVSRAHCQIVKLNDVDYGIKDLQSKNGTKLNGVKIEPSKVYKIQSGDVIKVSSEELHVQVEHLS